MHDCVYEGEGVEGEGVDGEGEENMNVPIVP